MTVLSQAAFDGLVVAIHIKRWNMSIQYFNSMYALPHEVTAFLIRQVILGLMIPSLVAVVYWLILVTHSRWTERTTNNYIATYHNIGRHVWFFRCTWKWWHRCCNTNHLPEKEEREIQDDSFVRQQTTNSYSMFWLAAAGGLGSVVEDYKVHQQHYSLTTYLASTYVP